MRPIRHALLVVLLLVSQVPLLAHAGALAQLQAFTRGTRSLSAHFEQQSRDGQGSPRPPSSGRLLLQVPGQLRWEYQAPYRQLIVSDGKTLWVFDPDLSQATRRPLDNAAAAGPLGLLANPDALQRTFKVSELPADAGGLAWLRLVPNGDASTAGFQQADLGFAGNLLLQMRLTDNLGQLSTFRFSDWRRNPRLDAAQFRFTPPAGTDVVEAGG